MSDLLVKAQEGQLDETIDKLQVKDGMRNLTS